MKPREHEALLSLGSNVEPHIWVPRALSLLRARHAVTALSPMYRTAAVGGRGPQPDFVNLAVRLWTDLPPRALREACRCTEEACGRRRTTDRYAPRPMDIDIALLDDLVLDLDTWRLPDPALATRPFVLVPCADVWPDAVHPTSKMTLGAMRRAMESEGPSVLLPLDPEDPEWGSGGSW